MSTKTSIRVRFAPSPTGFLHIGGVRTALFNWLYARRLGGSFILRVEDTDLERSEERFTADIMSSMKWLGLNWDEEVLFQSKRLDLYQAKADELILKNHAYKCWCTETEVEVMREVAIAAGKRPMYDRRCRERKEAGPTDAPFVIRAKVPLDGVIRFDDLIRGPIQFENTEIDDFVLIRSNGAPTYNLSVVVDDVEGCMTHIIRGDDHINNTPKQMHLYQFFNYTVPLFAHLPMILGPDKKKLSKRNGVVSANVYRAEGYLPEALLNFLARLGWSHGDQEVFTVQELIQFFDFDHVQKASGVFNAEKLLWLNGLHIRQASPERLQSIVLEDFASLFTAPGSLDRAKSALGAKLVALIQPKVKLMREMAEQLVPLCTEGVVQADSSSLKWNKDPSLKAPTHSGIAEVIETLNEKMKGQTSASSLGDLGMDHTAVDAILRAIGEKNGLKLGDFVGPMRLAVSGRTASASLFDLMVVLPWSVVESRLKVAIM